MGDKVISVIAFDSVPLTNAIKQLANMSGLKIEFDPSLIRSGDDQGSPIPQPNVTEKWKSVSLMQALQALLDNYGWVMEPDGNNPLVHIHFLPTNAVGPRRTKVNLFKDAGTAGGNKVTDVSFQDIELPVAIRQLALLTDINVQFDPRLFARVEPGGSPVSSPKVTETWKQVSVNQMLQALLAKYGLQLTQLPGNPIYRVEARSVGL